jgi:hypothetical protein
MIDNAKPYRNLTTPERRVWDRVMSSWPDGWFNSSDEILLTFYCSHVVAMDDALDRADVDEIVRQGKALLEFATKLRLTPQARVHPRTAGVAAENGREHAAADSSSLLGGAAWSHLEKPN